MNDQELIQRATATRAEAREHKRSEAQHRKEARRLMELHNEFRRELERRGIRVQFNERQSQEA